MSAAAVTLSNLFTTSSIDNGDAIERRHNRLAVIWIFVAIAVAITATCVELWTINHMVDSFMDGLTSHLMPAAPHHVTTAR